MAWRFTPPFQPSLLITKKIKPQFLPIFVSAKSSPMLNRIFSQKHIKLHLCNTVTPLAKSTFFRRPISFLAMAQQQSSSFSSSSQRHKHTNRLASEHSPYLLQHAHNPEC